MPDSKILYARGVDIPSEHQASLSQLISGEPPHGSVEKLRGCENIFSYRLNQADRLLFTYHNGSLLILEFIPNHDYQKSRFMRSGVLRRFLSTTFDVLDESMYEEAELPAEHPSVDADAKSYSVDVFQKQIILLTGEQESALNVALPAVV